MQVSLIQKALGSEAARAQFQKHVTLDEMVGVQDITLSFLAQADLLTTVEALAKTEVIPSAEGVL